MARATIQNLMLQRLDKIEDLLSKDVIPSLAGLKVKAAIAGGIAGIVGTSLMTLVVSAIK